MCGLVFFSYVLRARGPVLVTHCRIFHRFKRGEECEPADPEWDRPVLFESEQCCDLNGFSSSWSSCEALRAHPHVRMITVRGEREEKPS